MYIIYNIIIIYEKFEKYHEGEPLLFHYALFAFCFIFLSFLLTISPLSLFTGEYFSGSYGV